MVLGCAGPRVRQEEIAKSRKGVDEGKRRFARVWGRMIEGEGEVGGEGGVEVARITNALDA
jgi:hypothetical protein